VKIFNLIFSTYTNRLTFFSIIFISAFNLFLLSLPITRYFSYEFCLLNGVLFSFILSIISIFVLRKNDEKNLLSMSKIIFQIILIFLSIPLVFSLGNLFYDNQCVWFDGIKYYLVFTVPSAVVGVCIGVIAYYFSQKFAIIIAIIIWVIILLIPLTELYFNPQVYFYNPVITFFPGTIYDEDISIDLKLILYRLLNILFFVGISVYLWKRLGASNKRKIFNAVSIIVITTCFYFLSPYLGYSSNVSSIRNELTKTISTKHFEIYYSVNFDKNEIQYLVGLHELYYKELKNFFNTEPKQKIISFIFSDGNQKRKLFGAENADVAKPWLYQIYLSSQSYEQNLKHELAHIFSAEFGKYFLKVAANLNTGLIEGLAVAASFDYDDISPHFLAKTAYENNYRINMTNLFSTFGFFSANSSLGYVYSGSFIKYLVDNYGVEKVKKLYSSGNFKNVFNSDIKQLEKQYYDFLTKLDYTTNPATAEYYFGRKAFINKICPHFFANLLNKIYLLIAEKKYKDALKIIENIEEKTDNFQVIYSKIICLEKLKEYEKVIDLSGKYINKFERTPYEWFLKLKFADINYINGNFNSARNIYSKILHDNFNIRFTLATNLRLSLDSLVVNLSDYLSGDDCTKYNFLSKEKNITTASKLLTIINLEEKLGIKNSILFDAIPNKFIVNNLISFYTALEITRYALKKMRLDLADKYIKLAGNFSEKNEFELKYNNILAQVCWFNSLKNNTNEKP